MPRYSVLKSVAHNFAHSFVSVMNQVGNDTTMCHLVRRSRRTKRRVFRVDVLKRSLGPTDLVTTRIARAVGSYCDDFGRLITRGGAALDMVSQARLVVRIAHGRVIGAPSRQLHARITAEMTIVDDRGKVHLGSHTEDYVCAPPR